MRVERNSIIWVDLGYKSGRVQSGLRPCIVISNNIANRNSHIYTVVPGTTKRDKKRFPVHLEITQNNVTGCLKQTTTFLFEQICTIDEKQIFGMIGQIRDDELINQIDSLTVRQFGISYKWGELDGRNN